MLDLFTFRLSEDDQPTESELVEVKSRRDQLSKSQRRWIAANEADKRIPFRLVRVLGADLMKPPEVGRRPADRWAPPG